jgi:ubiquinone/menaquinone biosynthesis C-methylase UbiE
MLETIIEYMRCPRCESTRLNLNAGGMNCKSCEARYPVLDGVLDLMGNDTVEVITPFQRLMQTPLLVSVYEDFWRRLGYLLASSRAFEKEVGAILRLQHAATAERLLDLACGTGVFTRPLARGAKGVVVGLDLSWPMLRRAQRLLERTGAKNVVLMRGTAFRLPFIGGTFQAINCCGALHLFDQPDLALKEIGRVLHPAGLLSVQTTIRPEHSGGIAYLLERVIRFGFFNESELRERVRQHGLKILESERHRISFTFLARRVAAQTP